jgi:hypothetical protein
MAGVQTDTIHGFDLQKLHVIEKNLWKLVNILSVNISYF